MTHKIRLTRRADADINQIHNYINDDNPAAADRFLSATDECFKLIAAMPGTGRQWVPVRPQLAYLTDIRVYPIRRFRTYQVFYKSTDEEILILRIIHGARDIENVMGNETRSGDE